MLKYKDINVDEVREVFDYNEETGDLIWNIRKGPRANIGDVAGCYNNTGYRQIKYKGKPYLSHRLIWLYVYGYFPIDEIDHIDGDRANNRISNLRAVSRQENQKNTKLSKNSSTGIIGVYWNKNTSKWQAHITINWKQIYLGIFSDFFEACCARKSAESKYGFHPNHGRRSNAY
jgi:hypothetical protein